VIVYPFAFAWYGYLFGVFVVVDVTQGKELVYILFIGLIVEHDKVTTTPCMTDRTTVECLLCLQT
jgi:hypothetical protein